MKVLYKDSKNTSLGQDNKKSVKQKDLLAIKNTFKKGNVKGSLLNLKAQQPNLLNIWNSQQVATLYSAKLYLMWLKKVLSLMEEGFDVADVLSERLERTPSKVNEYNFASTKKRVRFMIDGNEGSQSSTSQRASADLEEFSKLLKSREHFTNNSKVLKKRENNELMKSIAGTIDMVSKLRDPMDQANTFSSMDVIEVPSVSNTQSLKRVTNLKDIMIDDPMWSEGSLTAFPFGKSPTQSMNRSHLDARYFLIEQIASSKGLLSHHELKNLIQEYLKTFPEEDEKVSDKFTSPRFMSSQLQDSQKEREGKANESINEVSPWKDSPNIGIDLSPFLYKPLNQYI